MQSIIMFLWFCIFCPILFYLLSEYKGVHDIESLHYELLGIVQHLLFTAYLVGTIFLALCDWTYGRNSGRLLLMVLVGVVFYILNVDHIALLILFGLYLLCYIFLGGMFKEEEEKVL
ncbi:hypothetical protein [Priestia endophytica]|uniref:Uncharacterized protein n=1 Tax=Priestia endophytica DSM 13796 TaxID=1121089 RepID=A0A1I6C062_9BACI|nr:hypothetical protein [Priestia endophytica]KYG33452.1 hypothetical protein AZF06_21650 [Priestia endophytica]SFQ86580.1 hypothetical protein SAMN02745910_04673 [Priestia endophytica DSM 13796]